MPWVTFKKLTELLDTIFPPPAAAQFVSNRGARRRAYENLSSLSQQIIDAPPNVRTRLREVLETALSPTAHDGERLCAARAVGRIVNLFHTKARHLEDNDWRHAAACALNTVTPEALGGVSDAWSTLLMLVEFNIDGALLIAVRRMAQFSAIPSRNAAAARRQGAARDRLFTMLARFATVDVATVMPIFGEVVELLIMCRLVPATSYSHVDSVFVAIAPLWRTSGAALQLGSEVIDRLVYEVGAALMRCSKRANGAAQQVADDQFVAAASTFIVLMRSLGGAAFMAEHLPSSTAPIRFISQCLGVAKMLPRAVGNLVFDCLELGFAPTLPSALVVQLCMGRHVGRARRLSSRQQHRPRRARAQAAVVWLDIVLKCLEYHTPTPEMVDALDVPAMLELRLSTNSDIVTRLLALQAAFFTDARAGATAVRTLARDVRLAHALASAPLSDDPMPAVRNVDVRHGHYRYLTTRGDARREIVFALRALAQVPASLLHFTSTASDTATLATATASMMHIGRRRRRDDRRRRRGRSPVHCAHECSQCRRPRSQTTRMLNDDSMFNDEVEVETIDEERQ
jgi:hypothetical protein